MPSPATPNRDDAERDDALLDFIRDYDRGLIRYAPALVRVERLIAQVAEAYPKKHMLVVATRINDVRYLERRLKASGFDVGHVIEGWQSIGKYQVVVTTYAGVGTGVADAANCSIAFYVNPTEVFQEFGNLGLKALRHARVYGFLPEGITLTSPLDKWTTALFGERRVEIPRHGRIARPTRVAFVKPRLKSRLAASENEFTARKRVIWEHELRNYRIAALAKLISADDGFCVHQQCPEIVVGGSLPIVARIGILVDSIEHGLAIKRHLPDWPLLVDGDVRLDGIPLADAAQLSEARGGSRVAEDVIVTTGALAKAGTLDVLIWADAGCGLPPVTGAQRHGINAFEEPLLIVDLNDQHHPLARKWTRLRKAAYEAAEWPVNGGPQIGDKDRAAARRDHRPPALPYQHPRERRWADGPFRTAQHYYQQRRKQRREQLRRNDGTITLEEVADRDHLVDCFFRLQREGGPAPGVDGISPRDIARCDIGDIAESLSKALKNGRWRPCEAKPAPIPKSGTSEMRNLKIPVTVDRWIGEALHVRLQPDLEKVYLDSSWGFRAERSVWQMLAAAECVMESTGRWVLAIDDIRRAFDSVRIGDVMAAHQRLMTQAKPRRRLFSDEVLHLIETLLRGPNQDREIGIDQGGPYSPDALNVLLHQMHDLPHEENNETLLRLRYADNLAYLCRSVTEGREALAQTRRLLKKTGLTLKGKDGIFDLDAGDRAQLLGFSLTREENRLRFALPYDWKERLRQDLVAVRESPDPTRAAREGLQMWIGAYGPAFESDAAVISEILSLAIELGFRDLPAPKAMHSCWEKAWGRWRTCRKRVRRRYGRKARRQQPS